MRKYLAAAVLFLGLTACCGSRHAMPLEGTAWKLASMSGIPAEAITAEADSFTLEFNAADTVVFGRTNCNRFFGHFEKQGQQLEMENMGMTRMACPDMQYEDMFVKMLDQTDRFEIRGSELRLFDDSRELAVFTGQQKPASPDVK